MSNQMEVDEDAYSLSNNNNGDAMDDYNDAEIGGQTRAKNGSKAFTSLLQILGISSAVDENKEAFYIQLKDKTNQFISKIRPRPDPLFRLQRGHLSVEEWTRVDDLCDKLYDEYQQRAHLLIKRLDVTFDSFLWSDRVRKMETELRTAYVPMKALLPLPRHLRAEDLIAANSELLHIVAEKTSSAQLCQGTRSSITDYIVRQRLTDRGGRTQEMMAPTQETFQQQQAVREGIGGHSRGGGRGGNQRGGNQYYGDCSQKRSRN